MFHLYLKINHNINQTFLSVIILIFNNIQGIEKFCRQMHKANASGDFKGATAF